MQAAARPTPDPSLLELVSFKWLMAGQGWWVNLSRMQLDADYLGACARCGLASGQPLLEQRSAELLAALGGERGQPASAEFAFSNNVRIQ